MMNENKKFQKQDCRRMAEELVAQMTVEEAASQLLHHSPAIERLGVKEYNWWNEGLHGVARAGIATVFPQAIGMAAIFDDAFIRTEAEVIAQEARAKYNAAQAEEDYDQYKGLTFWSPNINIFRDPRWGRGHETFGEDPYLTGRLGVSFIKGLQGEDKYMKAAACAKHFAVHSGPEALRHSFDAKATKKDMTETYLPAFEEAVKEADVEAIMGAYNRTNGEPCCGSKTLLVDILRKDWGFDGHVVSDCWAVADFHKNHKVTETPAQSASLAVRMGCDLNCGCTFEHLLEGLDQGLITVDEIRNSAVRLFTTRYKLGMFDEECPYNQIPYETVNQPLYQHAALTAAHKSMVLLKNDGILPLKKDELQTIAVIGPNAYSDKALYGNYNGDSGNWITNLDGIRREAGDSIRVFYSQGCHISKNVDDGLCKAGRLHSEAMAVGKLGDVIILCLGLNSDLEGEEGDAGNSFASGDKVNLLLPEPQQLLCEKILSLGKPVVMVVNSGSSLDLSAYESRVSAIIQAWYSGEKGGEALADILFGKVSPSGRLPLTFYYNRQPLPEFTDYRMAGRTYRYLTAAPWYPFGFGLSYTTFKYSSLKLRQDKDGLAGQVCISNTGSMAGDEVLQVYLRYEGDAFEKPNHKLSYFHRISLMPNTSRTVDFHISRRELESVSEAGERVLYEGEYTLFAGGCQPDEKSARLLGSSPLACRFTVKEGLATDFEATDAALYQYPDSADYTMQPEKKSLYNLHTPVNVLFANPETEAILFEIMPDLRENPHLEQLRKMGFTVNDMAGMMKDTLTPERLSLLEERLTAL